MPGRLIIRVHPDDRVDVKVEGLTSSDRAKPKGQKLCDAITKRLEDDLGTVIRRQYEGDAPQNQVIVEDAEATLDLSND